MISPLKEIEERYKGYSKEYPKVPSGPAWRREMVMLFDNMHHPRSKGKIPIELIDAVIESVGEIKNLRQWCISRGINYGLLVKVKGGHNRLITYGVAELLCQLKIPWWEYTACSHQMVKVRGVVEVWKCKFDGCEYQSNSM